MIHNKPTQKQYISLQEAYNLFNKKCFNDELAPVFITFQRQKKSFGYYWHEKLESRQDETLISEIALNIASFSARQDRDIFSTLLHEMVHHWQYCYGKPSRNGYHNKEWSDKMKLVGLQPSDTGEIGGKEIGQSITHYPIAGGLFDTIYNELKAGNITIDFNSLEHSAKKGKSANKVKYTCPMCEANAWGKAGLNIACGDCDNEIMLNGE